MLASTTLSCEFVFRALWECFACCWNERWAEQSNQCNTFTSRFVRVETNSPFVALLTAAPRRRKCGQCPSITPVPAQVSRTHSKFASWVECENQSTRVESQTVSSTVVTVPLTRKLCWHYVLFAGRSAFLHVVCEGIVQRNICIKVAVAVGAGVPAAHWHRYRRCRFSTLNFEKYGN